MPTRVFSWASFRCTKSIEEYAEELKASRHRRLCTAIPFPRLDWSEPKKTESNLEELYGYAEDLANSTIDWYGRKRGWKKFWSMALRFFMFVFAVLGVLVPLLKFVSTDIESRILKGVFGHVIANPSAAEVALILFGVAIGFHLIDHFAGFTNAWMRYMVAAMQVSEELMKFRFEWNELERQTAAPQNPTPAPKDPVSKRIKLVHAFCFTVFNVVRGETSVWADEIKSNVLQVAQHLQSTSFGRVNPK